MLSLTSKFICIGLLLSVCAVSAQSTEESSELSVDDGTSVTVTDLDTTDPKLWEMAAFAARQMSTKQRKLKLATLSAAEQIDSLYRLKVQLQPVTPGEVSAKRSEMLYCTVEVKSDQSGKQQWTVENFGCTIPAQVRRRRPGGKKPVKPAVVVDVPAVDATSDEALLASKSNQLYGKPVVGKKFEQPISNSISTDTLDQSLGDLVQRNQVKRQIVQPVYPSYYYQPRYVRYLQPRYPQYPMYYY